jgi:hypothetical protein
MCTFISLTSFQHLRTSASTTIQCPSRHQMSWFKGLSSASCSTLDFIPAHPTSCHIASPKIPLKSFNHPRHIFVTPLHFPACSIQPRHTAQCHHHSHWPTIYTAYVTHPLYSTSFSRNGLCFLYYPEDRSSKLLQNVDTYMQIYNASKPKRRIFITDTVKCQILYISSCNMNCTALLKKLNLLWHNTQHIGTGDSINQHAS